MNTTPRAHPVIGRKWSPGERVRITAQLIQVEDGSHLWSQSYDRKLENVFAIQTEIAASIAEALKISQPTVCRYLETALRDNHAGLESDVATLRRNEIQKCDMAEREAWELHVTFGLLEDQR